MENLWLLAEYSSLPRPKSMLMFSLSSAFTELNTTQTATISLAVT